jgi:hypothetical protein
MLRTQARSSVRDTSVITIFVCYYLKGCPAYILGEERAFHASEHANDLSLLRLE